MDAGETFLIFFQNQITITSKYFYINVFQLNFFRCFQNFCKFICIFIRKFFNSFLTNCFYAISIINPKS